MFIPRKQIVNLKKLLLPNKVVTLYGARRVGKTTLINKFIDELQQNPLFKNNILFISGEDIISRSFLESQSIQKLKDFIGKNRLLVIDEAQYVNKIGLNLKLVVDHIKGIYVIATGSSSFQLAEDAGEPLTGRKFDLKLFPIAQTELAKVEDAQKTASDLETRLLYGGYPEVITTEGEELRKRCLMEIVNSYLFKDILQLNGIKRSGKLVSLLQLLAFQIGNTVSYSELGSQLGLNKNTVERYLDLLEKTYVIFRLRGFSRNLRKEISKNPKYYFWDNGIRNALIANFNPLQLRDDKGKLWENYIISEFLKKSEYENEFANFYFWRTYDQQEIDLIKEKDGQLTAYEIKWGQQTVRVPFAWKKVYPGAAFHIIKKENYLRFIG